MATFFSITVNTDAAEWAKQKWDTYGFDYDTERTAGNVVIAWALEDGDDALKEALDEDGIEYETFEADPERFFA